MKKPLTCPGWRNRKISSIFLLIEGHCMLALSWEEEAVIC